MQSVIRRMTFGAPVVLNGLNALAALIILSGSGTAQSTSRIITADVVVYGGTSAGVIAAVQTAKMGRTAVLVSPTRYLGGMSSSGLGFTDTGNKQVIGGLAREFYRRIQR
ncbi:MAG: FAD-dependent oxidoreductase, partial [Planctomycetaceae bacterium]